MNRRTYLATQAAGAVSLAVPRRFLMHKIDPPLRWKSLKYGMIDIGDSTVKEKFQYIKEIGFDGVELDSPGSLEYTEIISAKSETGIKIPGVVCSAHWEKPLSDPDPAVRDECIAAMEEAINDCKAFGGTTVLLVPAVVNENVSYDEAWERSTAAIKKLLPLAKEAKIQIAIENVWNNFLLSPLEAVRYIDQFDSKMIGWYFDVGNIIRYGWPEQWIRILGERIIKIDIKDYSRKLANEKGVWEGFKVGLGDGDANWAAVNKALREIGYSGWGSAEVKGGDRVRLEEINTRMNKLYNAG